MKKILILTLSLLTINLVSKAQVEIVSGGSSAAYTVAVPGAFQLTNGLQVTFKAHTANSASATLNVSGTGAKSITKVGGSTVLSGSDILTNQIVTVAYDGTNWQMISAIGSTPSASNDWTTTGNSGTNSGVNYIGTSDAADLSFRTNGVIKARLTQKGQLEILNTGASIFIGESAGVNDDLNNRQNTFVGNYTGTATTTGNWNTALGYGALDDNITGTSNTAIGRVALGYSTGSNNTAIGTYSLFWGTTGSNNTAIGTYTGQTIKTGSNNTFLGYFADASDSNLTNATAIGSNAIVSTSNSLVLGNSANVGIGTSSPSSKLDVSSTSYSLLQLSTTGANSNVNIDINTTGAGTAQFSQYGGTGGFTFATQGTLPTPAMSIIDNGNVGIGTTAPAQKLEIQDGHILLSNTGTQSELRFKEASANGGNIISFKAPASLAGNVNYTLPIDVGAANDVLSSDGAGTLSWTTPAALVNIYNSNGSLTGARTVTQGANTLAFTASAVNAFSVDGTTFSIDASNNFVGIGTSSPGAKLDVEGGQIYSNWANPNSIPNVMIRNWNSGTGPGYLTGTLGQVTIVTSDAAEGKYAIQGQAGGDGGNKYGVYGNAMGLGTNYGGSFSANGGANNYSLYSVASVAGTSNGIGTYSTVSGNGTGTTYAVYGQNSSSVTGATYAGYFENFNSTGSVIYGVRSSLTGNSGAGGTKYGVRSEVTGTAPYNIAGYFSASGGTNNKALQLVDGSQANNRVLTSDAAGMATWTDLSTLTSGGATAWTRATPNIYPTTLTDNVGIGLVGPSEKLEVTGNIEITSSTNEYMINNARALNTSGTENVFVGNNAAAGSYNTIIGYQAGNVNTGISNTFVGRQAGLVNTGGQNSFFGILAGSGNTSGQYNTFIGRSAGDANTTGGNNTILGASADVGSGILTNATAIGYGAIVSQSNSLVLGNNVSVGIGTSTPSTNLDIVTTNTGGTGMQVSNTSAGGRQWRVVSTGSTSVGGAGKFQIYDNTGGTDMLTIDAVNGGEIGIGLNSTMSGRLHVLNSTATWSTYNNAVYGEVTGSTTSSRGIMGISWATGTYGIGAYGSAQGAAANNYGVYGIASGGGTNYAGYFAGNVYVQNTLILPSGAGADKVLTSDASGNASWQNSSKNTGFLAYCTAGQSLNMSTWTQVTFGAEEYDHGADFATNAYTVPTAGVYHFDANVSWTNFISAGGFYFTSIYVNGVAVKHHMEPSSTNYASNDISATLNLAAGDIVTIWIQHSGTGGVNTTYTSSNLYTWFSGYRVY